MDLGRAVDAVIGSTPVTWATVAATRRRLRVLGYHGVHDVETFERQLQWLRARFVPVTLDDVIAGTLPDRAVWVTFDDGDPTVITNAMPLLERHGIRATMFVCPGVIGTDHPHWWQTAAAVDAREVAPLKLVDDHVRRARVAAMQAETDLRVRQLTVDELQAFAAHGDVGNHTWDHPLLDRCDEDAQVAQIERAHDWLTDALGAPPRSFAYPNGNHTPIARRTLARLGYRAAVLFDHRLASAHQDPLRRSRLRVDDSTSLPRFAAVLAGTHPAIHAARQRLPRPTSSNTAAYPSAM